ncbi:MAG: hypothetical protein IPJ74_25300 [Saprospiraceae bacterium]|nr:hypothetical protein [Saprospiraceae bacterium]
MLFVATASFSFGQTVEELEQQLKETSDNKERLNILYELANKSLSLNAEKAEGYGKQAHNLATSLKNNGMAAQTAFVIASAFERQRETRNVDIWLKTAYNYAKQAGDSDLIIKSVDKRGRLWTRENPRQAANIYEEAFEYFSSKGTSITDLERKYEMQKSQIEREKRDLETQKISWNQI